MALLLPVRFAPFLASNANLPAVFPSSSYSRFPPPATFPAAVLFKKSMSVSADAAPSNAGESAPPTPVGGGGESDVVVQYVVLRRDLIDTWPLGSIVTQGCHASVAAIWSHRQDPTVTHYCAEDNIDSMHKVTLEVKGEAQLKNLAEKLEAGGIDHKLWIEQPENFPTCLATKPYPKSQVASFFRKLKLCK